MPWDALQDSAPPPQPEKGNKRPLVQVQSQECKADWGALLAGTPTIQSGAHTTSHCLSGVEVGSASEHNNTTGPLCSFPLKSLASIEAWLTLFFTL